MSILALGIKQKKEKIPDQKNWKKAKKRKIPNQRVGESKKGKEIPDQGLEENIRNIQKGL